MSSKIEKIDRQMRKPNVIKVHEFKDNKEIENATNLIAKKLNVKIKDVIK